MNKISVFSIYDSSRHFSISLLCDYDLENAKKSFTKNYEIAFSKICSLKDDDLLNCLESMRSTQLLKIGYFDPVANQLEPLDSKEIILDFTNYDLNDFVILFECDIPKNVFNKIFEVVKNGKKQS